MTFGCGSPVDCGRPNRKPVTVIRSLTSYNNCRCPKSWEHDPPHDLSDDDLHLLGEDEHHELPIEDNYSPKTTLSPVTINFVSHDLDLDLSIDQ